MEGERKNSRRVLKSEDDKMQIVKLENNFDAKLEMKNVSH